MSAKATAIADPSLANKYTCFTIKRLSNSYDKAGKRPKHLGRRSQLVPNETAQLCLAKLSSRASAQIVTQHSAWSARKTLRALSVPHANWPHAQKDCFAEVEFDYISPLVDLRSSSEFNELHLKGATNIPVSELEARAFELPPPFSKDPLRLFGHQDELERATELLGSKGWVLSALCCDTAEAEWTRTLEIEQGASSSRVWRPNEFLERMTPSVIEALASVPPSNLRPVAIDVGCGSGRDAVYLALALGPEWEVIAIDNHVAALDRTAELAKRAGVVVTCLARDLRKSGLPDVQAHLVHGCRFLDRNLMPAIRDEVIPRIEPSLTCAVLLMHGRNFTNPLSNMLQATKVLVSGGIFLWSHFLEGCEVYAPPRRPSRQLQRGELNYVFSEADFDILHDEVGELSTRKCNVPASFFAAQKPL
ncbi:hypothetical protein CYMTET_11402 [Cymbomonas tetramitiformis]|uniref:Rhodanese domain-containing protein n=1 Tax=Cymbomonas tetramitiformis TaxID=36881 RepID=A0AAE0LCV9_9CHLO|nr:hypothetical protein CYMTET_11402 [Cymbomonas tetramitiformis]